MIAGQARSGCQVEYDADMDLHDDEWAPRETPMTPEASQMFLFEHREKWAPGGGKPGRRAHECESGPLSLPVGRDL